MLKNQKRKVFYKFLYLRIIVNGKRSEFSTGKTVDILDEVRK